MNHDYAIYLFHAAFWASFPIARVLSAKDREAPAASPTASEERAAPGSRALLFFHMLGIGTMYFGIARAVIPAQVPELFPFQRIAGAIVIALGAILVVRSVMVFRSWRLRAKVDAGHELVTSGPFALVRHPIYAAMTLLALGTVLWVPTPIAAIGFGLVFLGSDLRGRAEEKLLSAAFGDQYRDYMRKVRRFIPFVY